MQKIKFDFEATKQIIDVAPDASVRIGAPVNANGVLANDGTAIGIVLDAQGVGVHRQLVVMVAGYCDIIDAQAIWGDEYSAEAIAAMSDITFCDNHQLPTGGGGGAMVVHFTFDDTTETGVTADKTVAETVQMLNNGAVGFVYVNEYGVTVYGNIASMYIPDSDPIICACCATTGESVNNANVIAVVVSFDGETWEAG